MIIYCDIDGTICTTDNMDYKNSRPIKKNINKMNSLYDKGHTIVYWTSRGILNSVCWYDITLNQLKKWGVMFHQLRLDKPIYDLFIDDKALSEKVFFK